MVIFRQGPPLTGASNADEVGRIAGYRSMAAGGNAIDGRRCSSV